MRLLSNYYQLDTIIAIVGIAIEKGWPIYFRNRKTRQDQQLTVEQLFAVRKDCHIHIPLEVTPVYRTPLGGSRRGLAEHQRVDTIDLFVDESTLGLIKIEFEVKVEIGVKQTALPNLQSEKNPIDDEVLTDEEANLAYLRNPKDRDARLREEAIQMLLLNPKLKLVEIHSKLVEQEEGKSDVSVDILKHAVKYNDILRAAKKINPEKFKSEKVR